MESGTRYRAIRKIAEGGSAEIYLAEQLGAAGFRRHVVLKRIRSELYADAHYREVLIEEAQLAMSLHHSNLVEVLDLGESGSRYFLVLELVDGWTLQQVLKRARAVGLPLPPPLAVYIAAEICRGLAYAHGRMERGEPLGIVHRDVCPNNVLLSTHAEVKLIDFGIAKSRMRATHTGIGLTKGKPAWMSPEQARAEPLDARSDLYSVGSVLFAMLTDHPPYSADSDLEVISLVSRGAAAFEVLDTVDLASELRAIVLMAMSRKREARFESAQEMLQALETLQRSWRRPAGRSELENYLRALSMRDGDTAITHQALPDARPMEEAAPIELSKESAAATKALMTPRRRWSWTAAVIGLMAPLLVVAAALGFRHWEAGRGEESAAVAVAPVAVEPPAAEVSPPWDDWGEFPAPLPGPESLKVSARLADQQRSGRVVSVVLESEPAGVVIKVDERELGRTPATVQLKNGRSYELCFEAKGSAPVRQRLLLTPRVGRLPKLSLRAP